MTPRSRLQPWLLALVAGALLSTLLSAGASAHHSLSGMYDQSRRVTVEGVIAEFHNVNPHPFLLLDGQATGEPPQRWKLELDNRGELAAIGVTNETWKTGDRVVVSGSPGRIDARLLYVWKLERPADGFQYEQIGTSPRVRRPR
jgi:hypothetical protein